MTESNKTYHCFISGKPIPQERVDALLSIGVPEHELTHIDHSVTPKTKGIMVKEGMIRCRKVYNNSIYGSFDSNEDADEE